MWMAMNYGHAIPDAELIAWQDRIFAQDRATRSRLDCTPRRGRCGSHGRTN
jgi:hypothetical protein